MFKKKSLLPIILLLIFFILFYLPIFNIMYQSFFCNNNINFSGYIDLFSDRQIIYSFFNSIFIAIITIIISLFIALCSIKYFFLNKKSLLLFLVSYLNLMIPETVLAIALLLFFTLAKIKLSIYTLIISHIVLTLGYVVPLLLQKFYDINTLYIVAAYDLGASVDFTWKTIIIPLLKPTIIASAFLTFIISFDDYVFSFFCTSVETLTISTPLLSLLRTGLNLKIKAFFSCMIFFSLGLGTLYLLYVGFNNEK